MAIIENSDEHENQKGSPLIFISHDARDGELAEAFSKLLKSVSAGMLKSFRSSDKKGGEGIEFGDEWYKTLMEKLISASDVVCLLTERSLERPWILYEAGVAKGKLNTPVHGVALGIPLSRVGIGPFYQFQNSDDSEELLTKLVLQLCRRITGLEPDADVVKAQVQAFKSASADIIKSLSTSKKNEKKESVEEGAVAKVLEEMKLLVRELPLRLEERIVERPDRIRPERSNSFRPSMIYGLLEMTRSRTSKPVEILIVSSILQKDFPWLYELGLEAYRAFKSGNADNYQEALHTFVRVAEMTAKLPLGEFCSQNKGAHMVLHELPLLIQHYPHNPDEKRMPRRTRFPKAITPTNNT